MLVEQCSRTSNLGNHWLCWNIACPHCLLPDFTLPYSIWRIALWGVIRRIIRGVTASNSLALLTQIELAWAVFCCIHAKLSHSCKRLTAVRERDRRWRIFYRPNQCFWSSIERPNRELEFLRTVRLEKLRDSRYRFNQKDQEDIYHISNRDLIERALFHIVMLPTCYDKRFLTCCF